MLVLSRKVGQQLVIGDNIRITINRVGGSRVTLGIEAPDDVRVVRGELEAVIKAFEDAEVDASSDTAAEAQAEPVAQQPHKRGTGVKNSDKAAARRMSLADRVASRVRPTAPQSERAADFPGKTAGSDRSSGRSERRLPIGNLEGTTPVDANNYVV